jgi:hypothetical protein
MRHEDRPRVTRDHVRMPRELRWPQATVRDFLTSAVVDDNGPVACTYLTQRAQIGAAGLAEFRPPPTGWRVDSGIAAFGPAGQPPTSTNTGL